MILSGTFYNSSQDPNLAAITGFIPPNNGFKPGTRGFSLNDTELTIGGAVDPYFRGQATISVTPENSVALEEAYFQTLSLPEGLGLKGGRYFSNIAYLNQFHPHAWDFVDAPLVYQAYWGQNLAIDGGQLAWVAPTNTYLAVGLEFGQGKNLPGEGFREKNGTGTGTLYAQMGDDIGRESSYLAGISVFQTSNKATDGLTFNALDPAGTAVQDTYTGTTRIAGGYFVYKWAPNRDTARSGLKLQAEYYQRWLNGDLAYDVGNATGAGRIDRWRQEPAGGVVRPGGVQVRSALARRRALRSSRHTFDPARSAARRARRYNQLQAVARKCDGRLVAHRVLAAAVAVQLQSCARGRRRQPDLPSVHHEPRIARGTPVLSAWRRT